MSRATLKRPVEDVLVTIAALRRLCLTLPHALTPDEARRLDRFERLRQGAAPPSEEDIEALRTGLRHCWRRGDAGTLREIAARIPSDLLDRDRWLQSFMVATHALAPAPERFEGTPRDGRTEPEGHLDIENGQERTRHRSPGDQT